MKHLLLHVPGPTPTPAERREDAAVSCFRHSLARRGDPQLPRLPGLVRRPDMGAGPGHSPAESVQAPPIRLDAGSYPPARSTAVVFSGKPDMGFRWCK